MTATTRAETAALLTATRSKDEGSTLLTSSPLALLMRLEWAAARLMR